MGAFCGFCLMAAIETSMAADSLIWRAKENRVDVEVTDWTLNRLLTQISKASGWKVFIEPGTTNTISAKFKNATTDDALRRLLGRIDFALESSNGVTCLYIYRTTSSAATRLIDSGKKKEPKDYRIANELVVRLKKGSKVSIDELAKQVGAKVVGRDDALGIYRLQFTDEDAAKNGRSILEKNENVAWVDSNYTVDQPSPVNSILSSSGNGLNIQNKDVNPCSPIVGLIDTAVQPQLEYTNYLLNQISVVGDVSIPTNTLTHGTGMLETMLNAMSNSPSKILPVVVYQNGESTTTYEVARGIVQAVNAGANPINLSLGGTGDSAYLKQLISDAHDQGVVFVAAAGNDGGTSPTYPAAWPGVVAVTASDSSGHVASYANSGSFVEAMVSGSSLVDLNGQLWQMEGTSVSTAKVTGMIASQAASGCVSSGSVVDQVVSSLPVK